MSNTKEFASNDTTSFDWSRLPAGEYKLTTEGEIVPIDGVDRTIENVTDALRRLAATLGVAT